MKIGTGYFAKSIKYHEMGYALVCISRKVPWFIPSDVQMYHYGDLAPSAEILWLKDYPEEYTKRYKAEILNKVNRMSFVMFLYDLANRTKTDKVALLCFEAPEKFCHRHIVAEWLNEINLGVDEIETNNHEELLFDSI